MGLFNAILGNASEVTIESASKEFEPILIEGEEIEKAFRSIKDMFVFTNKRLILVEKQLVGSKVDYLSIPYKNIKKFSKESAGILDLDADLIGVLFKKGLAEFSNQLGMKLNKK